MNLISLRESAEILKTRRSNIQKLISEGYLGAKGTKNGGALVLEDDIKDLVYKITRPYPTFPDNIKDDKHRSLIIEMFATKEVKANYLIEEVEL